MVCRELDGVPGREGKDGEVPFPLVGVGNWQSVTRPMTLTMVPGGARECWTMSAMGMKPEGSPPVLEPAEAIACGGPGLQ